MTGRRIVRPRRSPLTAVGRTGRDLRVRVGATIRSMREDAGISQRRLSATAGIDHGFLSLVERGEREPSLTTLTAIDDVLGADLSVRLYPTTGPRLRDPIQSRILEALIRLTHPGWDRMVEVPARGVIDAVLLRSPPPVAVCTEIQSELWRLEQLVRWANEKSASLPSAPFWERISETPRIDRLLVIRSTRTNREIVTRFSETLRKAYPAPTALAYAALRDPAVPWPGSALLWARLDGDKVTIMDAPPRGIALGR